MVDIQKQPRQKIFVIDDDDDLREVICWALEKEGHEVLSFKKPHHALMVLQQGKRIPALIIVDYYMDGMDGGEFLDLKNQSSQAEIRSIPVLIISGSPHEVEREVPREMFKEIISKPIDLEGLSQTIYQYISRPGSVGRPTA